MEPHETHLFYGAKSVNSAKEKRAPNSRSARVVDQLLAMVQAPERVLVCIDPLTHRAHFCRPHVPSPEIALVNLAHSLEEKWRSAREKLLVVGTHDTFLTHWQLCDVAM